MSDPIGDMLAFGEKTEAGCFVLVVFEPKAMTGWFLRKHLKTVLSLGKKVVFLKNLWDESSFVKSRSLLL